MAKFRGIRSGEEQINEPYIRLPYSLLTREDISGDSKLLFGLILTRTAITQLNDERGFFFIYLTGENDPKELLKMSKSKVYRCLNELEEAGLIERKRSGYQHNVMIFPSNSLLLENTNSPYFPELKPMENSILPKNETYGENPYFPELKPMENEVQNSVQIVQNSAENVQNSIGFKFETYEENSHRFQNSEVSELKLQQSQICNSNSFKSETPIFKITIQEKSKYKRVKDKSKHIESEQVEKIPSGDSSGRATYFGDLIDEEGNVQEDPLINPNDYDSTGRRIRPRTAEEARRLYWEHQKIRDAVYERDKKRRFG